jgi:hypothetical protein
MTKRMMQKEKSFDNNVVKENQRTTKARENRKSRPDLMMNNLVKVMISAWWSTSAIDYAPGNSIRARINVLKTIVSV